MSTLPPASEYCVAFDVVGKEKYLKAVVVGIRNEVYDSTDEVRIDLRDHPLYADLQEYILNNPVPRKRATR